MNPVLAKLYKTKHFSKENVAFVHLGDSHIQADLETSVIRKELQNYFGNAGRGLVFPYQVAKTNAPYDIISSSKSSWKNNRVARTDTLISCGISAFGITSISNYPEFNLELRTINGYKDTFDKVKLFMGGTISELNLVYNDSLAENECYDNPPIHAEYNLKSPASGFKLSFPTTDTIQFYGASLEKKDTSGVIYHSVGANGAKYSDYNKTSKFWEQLKYLKADCYIISLGTNEAQDPNLKAENFLVEVNSMINKIRLVSPNACIVLTTPPVSYYKKLRPNQSLQIITDALIQFSNENNLVYWDLFNASRGSEGNLFVDAFAKVWNEFLNKN